MASITSTNTAGQPDWTLAHPWLWLGTGFTVVVWSWIWTLAYGQNASDLRVALLALGLLVGCVGVWLRWNDRQLVHLAPWRGPVALFLGCFFALLCLTVTVLFVLTFFMPERIGLRSGPMFLVWISAAPLGFFAARSCLRFQADVRDDNGADAEISLAFIAMAGLCLLGSLTLYADRDDPNDWDTMRRFLRVFSAVSLYAAGLPVVSRSIRRMMLSLLFTLHFVGIATAVMVAPPAPWIIQQAWMRVFRPYLQFVYLTNAYHFYAPEPGPATYLWFRVIYETPDGVDQGLWYKIPQLDDKGRIKHPVALEYQRFLSITEATNPSDLLPQEFYFNIKSKQWQQDPFWAARLNLVPMANQAVVLGQPNLEVLRVPLHPSLHYLQQAWKPNDEARRLLGSYARFVARKFVEHPEHPDWKYKSVKIYRVVHSIPPVQWFLTYIPPTDPELYRPFYVGHFDQDGMQRNEPDPYLYWLLPSIRDNTNDPDAQIKDYARRHAGDPEWIRPQGQQNWVAP